MTTPSRRASSHQALLSARARALGAVGLLLVAACGGAGGGEPAARPASGPNKGPIPTLPGGVELAAVDPASVLVGEGLAFGRPLPSEQAAAEVFAEEPEVRTALVRRVLSQRDGRVIGRALVLRLDGDAVFDQSVLDAFITGVVGALGGAPATGEGLGGRPVLRARGGDRTAVGFREGDVLVVVTGGVDRDVRTVVGRQLAAIARGATGSLDPMTPLLPAAVDAAFVAVPTLSFEAIPPPEDETPPEAPALVGASAVEGRYGVVAGERRATVWAYVVDLAEFPTAESHDRFVAELVSASAGGAAAAEVEVVDRLVVAADGAEGTPSARAFRHRGLVLLVQGLDPAQLDASLADWITALG